MEPNIIITNRPIGFFYGPNPISHGLGRRPDLGWTPPIGDFFARNARTGDSLAKNPPILFTFVVCWKTKTHKEPPWKKLGSLALSNI